MVVSAGLVVGPIIFDPKQQQIYILVFILAGIIFYIPFIYYKKVLPGMGNCINRLIILSIAFDL